MLLTVRELDPKDLPHLFCTDTRISDEVEAINRSLKRLDEGIPTWTYRDPQASFNGKEVTPCQL